MARKPSPELIQRIIELIMPFMVDSQDRHTYIDPWCTSFHNLYKQIDWAGPPHAFTTHVVDRFLRHGFVTSDKTALEYFLESVHEDMGVEGKAEVDTILKVIQESKSVSAPDSSPTEPSRSKRSCTLTLTFASIILGAVMFSFSFFTNGLPGQISGTPIALIPTGTLTFTPTKLFENLSNVTPTGTPIIVPTSIIQLNIVPTPTSKRTETSMDASPTVTSTPMAPTPTNSPFVEPTVSSILTATSTPIAVLPATPVCLSIIGYDDENALKDALITKAGFSPSDNLGFYNGNTFAEVCVTKE